VYSRDARRPVEVAADQEQQLVAWLSKRLGASVHAPHLAALGYELIGGRLLPGERGPVAQFMYQDGAGQRLTLYVTHDAPAPQGAPETAFRFGRDGPVNVFYWVDRGFGYAMSGGSDRAELMRVSQEVYRQLGGG
jgi:anti-sigma factor RsiW